MRALLQKPEGFGTETVETGRGCGWTTGGGDSGKDSFPRRLMHQSYISQNGSLARATALRADACAVPSCKHVSEPKGSFLRRRGPAASLRSATRWRSPNSSPTLLASLFVYSHTELVMGVGPPPPRPPPHYLFYLMGPLLFPHAHLFIYFFPSTLTLRVTGFNIVGET